MDHGVFLMSFVMLMMMMYRCCRMSIQVMRGHWSIDLVGLPRTAYVTG